MILTEMTISGCICRCSEKQNGSQPKTKAQVLWDHDVAGTNMVAWQFYSLQYDALRSEGKRENNLKRKIKETTKNHERKIPKNNQKIK